jgi:hypothetical protein
VFDPKRYLDVARKFAELAASDQPDAVKQLTGGLEMVNRARDANEEEMLLALFRFALREVAPDWRIFVAPQGMAEVFRSGNYFAVVPADAAPGDEVTTLTELLPGLRLFRFEDHNGNEQNCSHVAVADSDLWGKRAASRQREAENAAFDTTCRAYMWQLAKAAYDILERTVARQTKPSSHVVRHLSQLKWALDNDGQMGETDSEMYGTIDGFPPAMTQMIFVAVALDIKPSKLLAEAEKQVEGLLG